MSSTTPTAPTTAASAGKDSTATSTGPGSTPAAEHDIASVATTPLVASCHCGLVKLTLPSAPTKLNECQCSICYRYGALWAYYKRADVQIASPQDQDGDDSQAPPQRAYVREDGEHGLGFHFCGRCGCLTHWAGIPPRSADMPRIGVNGRMLDPAVIKGVERRITYL